MKYINKNDSPVEFENWKKQHNPNRWNHLHGQRSTNLDENILDYSKEELREALLEEQFNTCAYCEYGISQNSINLRIDHVLPRHGDNNPERIFDYKNLVLSCSGYLKEDGKRIPKVSICDPSKGDNYLSISPLQENCSSFFKFSENGRIFGTNNEANDTINILNLNHPKLDNLRKGVIEGFLFDGINNETYLAKEDYQILLESLLQNQQYKTAIQQVLQSYSF